ncbi:unnamed protein product [Rhizophagus irregularis]|nr:unnamed protein product [Rhizophagus irregularis]
MSFYRRGCVTHQKYIDFFQNTRKPSRTTTDTLNNKISHAICVFDTWGSSNIKHVYSNRLGISYDVRYLANRPKKLDIHNDRCMYRKRFDNFNSHSSNTTNTGIRQHQRFERSCRSIFKRHCSRDHTYRPVHDIDDQLGLARKHCFMFLPSQSIFKRIQHVQYQNNSQRFVRTLYNFPIPELHFVDAQPLDTVVLERRSNEIVDIVLDNDPSVPDTMVDVHDEILSNEGIIRHDFLDTPMPADPALDNSTVALDPPISTLMTEVADDGFTRHDTLGILIPNDLLPYVDDKPIYISKRQAKLRGRTHDVGSLQWFEAVKLRKDTAERAAALKERADTQLTKAKLWGTSRSRIDFREGLVDDLTAYQDYYYDCMTGRKTNKKTKRFLDDYYSFMDKRTYEPYYRYKGQTSDDTRLLELRPKKRPTGVHTTPDKEPELIKKLRFDLTLFANEENK